MNSVNYIIIYSKETNDGNSNFGFGIFEKEEASKYMKCVEILSNHNISFEFENSQEFYAIDYFTKMKISQSELKTLNHLFEINSNGDKIGVIPNAISDAYDLGLIDDYENQDEDFDDF